MLAALLLLVAVGGIGVGAVELLRAPVTPAPGALPEVLLAAVPVALGAGLPLAVVAALAAVLLRWEEEGGWLVLRSCGSSGRALLPGALLVALTTGLASFALSHHIEPAARASLREALREGLRPVPGQPLDLGGGVVVAEAVEEGPGGPRLGEVFFAGEALVGSAREAWFEGEVLVLAEGRAHAPGPPEVTVAFERARVPIAAPGVRIELVERATPELAELVARMEAKGRDAAYERAVLVKRSAWPLSAGLFALLTVPLALGRHAGRLAVAVLGYWVLVRLCDGAASTLGGTLAGWTPTGALALATLATWLSWSER